MVLPEPDSPISPITSPRFTAKLTLLDDLALRAVAGRSGNTQIADIDQGFHHVVPSRRPNSPSIVRFTAIVRLAMASAGMITAGAP